MENKFYIKRNKYIYVKNYSPNKVTFTSFRKKARLFIKDEAYDIVLRLDNFFYITCYVEEIEKEE